MPVSYTHLDVYKRQDVYSGANRDLRNIFIYISEELLAQENAAGQKTFQKIKI